jgi:hypothetical protein
VRRFFELSVSYVRDAVIYLCKYQQKLIIFEDMNTGVFHVFYLTVITFDSFAFNNYINLCSTGNRSIYHSPALLFPGRDYS